MAEKKELSFQNRVEQKLSLFMRKNKNLLLILGAALILALIIVIIVLSVSSSQAETRQEKIDALTEQYTEWTSTQSETEGEGSALPETLVADLSDLAGSSKGSYPALKAEYLLGLIAFEQENYDEAISHLETVVDNGKDTYLASLALFNLGVVSEKNGDTQGALAYYQSVYESSEGEAVESARALFNVGRIHELNGDSDLALAVLQQLADEFPNSEYAKLALSHIVLL